jgi:hypothetical protein
MAAHVFRVDELATRIATHLFAISPKSTVALALTCRALEVPALRALWEAQPCSLDRLIMRVLSADALCFVFPRSSDLCLLVSFPSLVQCPFYILIDHEKFNRPWSDRSPRGS